MKKKYSLFVLLFLFQITFLFPQIGYFLGDNDRISSDLKIYKMDFNITLDNEFGIVKLTEIVKNTSPKTREGFFFSNLPINSLIDDFVIYRDLLKIPSVILTKRNAKRIYEKIVWLERDPGLLEMSYTYGESETTLSHESGKFSVSIYPINPFSYKRIEFSYITKLPVKKNVVHFNLPITSKFRKIPAVKNFSINLKINSSKKIKKVYLPETLNFSRKGNIFSLKEKDFRLNMPIDIKYEIEPDINKIYFFTYKKGKKTHHIGIEREFGGKYLNLKDGYFLAQKYTEKIEKKNSRSRDIFLLVDFSLSMKWSNLKKLYFLINFLVKNLNENEKFNIFLFNKNLKTMSDNPQPANDKNKTKALEFVENSYFLDGTDIKENLKKVFNSINSLKDEREKILFLIGDFIPTVGDIKESEIVEMTKGRDFKIYSLGIGENVNSELLKNISNGFINLNEIGLKEIGEFTENFLDENFINLTLVNGNTLFDIYPSKTLKKFSGDRFDWFGRYKLSSKKATISIKGDNNLTETASIEDNSEMEFIPKLWAKSKIDYLLQKINREGEKKEYVKEIVALSKAYKIVTPYTSLLAAPRSLLRPRYIQPGDPVIKVKAPSETASVSAMLPTGETLDLTYLRKEKIWKGKFILPANFLDGKYSVEIIMRDKRGNIFRERKKLVIDTKPPIFKLKNLRKFYKAGENIELSVISERDTRDITAVIPGFSISRIKWDKYKNCSTGILKLPEKPGIYKLKIISEDFARNQYFREYQIKIK